MNINQDQDRIQQIGREIFSLTEDEGPSLFNKDWWYGRIMDWSMRNETFKTQMFRFVDVLPYLNSSDEVSRHLKEYFSAQGQEMPSVLGWGMSLSSLAPGLMASTIKKNVTQMARMFITGQDEPEALKALKKMRDERMTFTVDLLGEAAVSEFEAWEYQKRYISLIEKLHAEVSTWLEDELLDRDHLGPIPRVNVSVKVSSLFSQFDPINFEGSIAAASEKLRPILRRARDLGVFINFDMESYLHKDLTLELFKRLLTELEFRGYNDFGIVVQAYLKESERDLRGLIEWAKRDSRRITIRLVKGAYWDYETVNAAQKGWPTPVFTDKRQTDANYEKLTTILLENDREVKAAFGSHNVRSLAHALAEAERLGVDRRSFEIQMLYGMAEAIKKAMVKKGMRVRQYAPVGDLIPGMAYLVRRLLENTSNESFLRARYSAETSPDELLKSPELAQAVATRVSNGHNGGHDPFFQNEPPTDFNRAENRRAYEQALEKVKKRLGQTYPLVIGKKEIKTKQTIKSVNPAAPSEIVGHICLGSAAEADQAVETCRKTFLEWSSKPASERAAILDRAANIISERRFELMALETYEVGKTWREADGDVAEAIDFCRYYAGEIRKLERKHPTTDVPGEDAYLTYKGRGVAVVIAPWNFPLAILCGMTVAALGTGNTVIMKPAEQSSVIASWLFEILRDAGVTPGAVQFLPGLGEEVGEYLINHHDVDLIAFTGSRDVGLHIIEKAAITRKGQRQVKKVIAEMGGKNAIIIDNDADLDEAVIGVIHSAFGFQGQKCSACSRLIVLDEIYDKLVHRLVEAARSLRVGPPALPSTDVAAVIDEEAYKKISQLIAVGKEEAKLLYQAQVPTNLAAQGGYFIAPTVFADVAPTARIAQEEIFGPVLAIIRVKNFDEALAVANGTDFALTGGVYSRSPAHLEQAAREFDVGNLYLNRGITGALVGRHPFGGFKMSGIGSKAGGPDYLLQFVEPKAIAENTLRRGFAPSQDSDKS